MREINEKDGGEEVEKDQTYDNQHRVRLIGFDTKYIKKTRLMESEVTR